MVKNSPAKPRACHEDISGKRAEQQRHTPPRETAGTASAKPEDQNRMLSGNFTRRP